jgi:hypothetical protein
VDLGELAIGVDPPQPRVDVGDEDIPFLVPNDPGTGVDRSQSRPGGAHRRHDEDQGNRRNSHL